MLGYRIANVEGRDGLWLVRFAAFENVVGHGASAAEAHATGLAALIRWIEVLIENRWAIPAPIDVVDQDCALVIEPALAMRIQAHNEVCARIRRLDDRPVLDAPVGPPRQPSAKRRS